MQNLYTENLKTLLREIKDLNKWRNTLCSWFGKFDVGIVPKLIYSFERIHINIPSSFLTGFGKMILQFK